jgi:hypothetical protein
VQAQEGAPCTLLLVERGLAPLASPGEVDRTVEDEAAHGSSTRAAVFVILTEIIALDSV